METTTKAQLRERDHLEGCPGKRVERYEAIRPRKGADEDGNQVVLHRKVTVTRCIDCGGERVTQGNGDEE